MALSSQVEVQSHLIVFILCCLIGEYIMNSVDLTPLYRSSIGFDSFASMLDSALTSEAPSSGYPPYNIEVKEENNYAITLAVAGFSQEELDIQFLFIHGTPPRDVLGLQHIWKPGVHRSYSNLLNDRYFEPRTLALHPQATAFKLRSTITGHGQEGEFIPRNHFLNINGGSPEVEWQVWTECADNPIYPQGGTWVYDRAGWCPGAASDLLEYEIDPDDITGSTMEIDYGISSGSGTSNYYVSNQIVSYGAPNFTTDAAVISVERPTDKTEQMRFNPNCSYPIITIQNTGSANLNSLKISTRSSVLTSECM